MSGKNVELVGANQEGPLAIQGGEVRTSVKLDTGVRRKVAASLAAVSASVTPERAVENAEPDRVFLHLENVRGAADSPVLQVYVAGKLAGSVALFGVRKASKADGKHAGQGLNLSMEITDIVDELHLNKALDVDAVDVRIVPVTAVHEKAKISVGRVSIYREGR